MRDLGQNFLIDSNLLDVIAREAELGRRRRRARGRRRPRRAVRAPRRARRARPRRRDRPQARARAARRARRRSRTPRCTSATPSSSTTRRSTRAPTKVIANLPYGVAATVILDTVVDLPTVTRWVAMVQREVGERLAAAPGTPAYGAPSVLAQLSLRGEGRARGVADGVPPRAQRRLRARRAWSAPAPPAPADVRALVSAPASPTAARRCRARSRWPAPPARDARPRRAGRAIGLPEDVRAERLAPAQWVALAEALR